MIQAIIFDCFGVIITDALEVVLQQLDVERPGARDEVVDIIHANNLGLLQPSESNEQIAKILGVTAQEFRETIDGAEAKDQRVLDWIRELRTDYKTALLSNIGRDSMNRRFSEQELQEHFDAVIISGDLGIAKPNTAIYEYAAQQLGVPTEACVFLDDREGHCEGARAAGMQAILYLNLAQAQADLKKVLAK